MTKIERLTERVERLKPTNLGNEDTVRKMKRFLGALGEDEQIRLARIIYNLEKDEVKQSDVEAWLLKRPKEDQALVRKWMTESEGLL